MTVSTDDPNDEAKDEEGPAVVLEDDDDQDTIEAPPLCVPSARARGRTARLHRSESVGSVRSLSVFGSALSAAVTTCSENDVPTCLLAAQRAWAALATTGPRPAEGEDFVTASVAFDSLSARRRAMVGAEEAVKAPVRRRIVSATASL